MRVLLIANHINTILLFRKELVDELVNQGFEVYIALPLDDDIGDKINACCKLINLNVERHGTNPFQDFKVFTSCLNILKTYNPDIVLTFTVKPNIYGSYACRITKTPYINNVTGVGTALQEKGIVSWIMLVLMKVAFKKSFCVFFQNKGNFDFFISNKVLTHKTPHCFLPGSGVNLSEFRFEPMREDDVIRFLIISRVRRDKGYQEFFDAAKYIRANYPNTEFHVVGMYEEEDLSAQIDKLNDNGTIIYHGALEHEQIHDIIAKCDCLIHPSYHEGMANVNLEAAASGRPIITTNIPGCRETFDEGITGFGCEVRSTESLIKAIEKYLRLGLDRRKKMGFDGRKKMESEFDRTIVIKAYLDRIMDLNSNGEV